MKHQLCGECGRVLGWAFVCLPCIDQAKQERQQRIADLEQELAAMQAERDAARAGLARAVDVVRDLHAECCMPWVTVVRDQYTLRMQPVLKRAEQICADPLGQQAAAEWQRLRELADAMLAWDKLNATYQRAVDERNYGTAEAVVTDWGASWDRVVAALAALQQPEKGDQPDAG